MMNGHTYTPAQSVSPWAKTHTVGLYAPSKTFNLAGLIGSYSVIYDKTIRERAKANGDRTHYNEMNVLSQHALVGAYSEEGANWLDQLLPVLSTNVNLADSFVREKFGGVSAFKTEGTYMMLLDLHDFLQKSGLTQQEVLKKGWEYGIGWQDGRLFEAPEGIRLNLASPCNISDISPVCIVEEKKMATFALPFPTGIQLEYRLLCLLFPDICLMADTDGPAIPVPKTESEVARAFDRCGDACLRLAYSYLHNNADAEDILQEVFIRYMQKSPEFENSEHEKAWLLRVTANLSKNRLDYKKVRDADELSEELVAEERQDLSFVWEAVKSLPEAQRSVIHLFYQEGYQTAEIAQILDMKEATVRSHLKRGRDHLKSILKEDYDFGEI